MKTFLLTGFEPFNSMPLNPSAAVAEYFSNYSLNGIRVISAILPVIFGKSGEKIISLIEQTHPDAVLSLGLEVGQIALKLERIALNLNDSRIPDNQGNCPKNQPIVQNGLLAYQATFPLIQIKDALLKNKIPAIISNYAGTYVCNHVFYITLHYLKHQKKRTPCGFVHLPATPELACALEHPVANMSLDTMLKGIEIVIQVVAKYMKDWS